MNEPTSDLISSSECPECGGNHEPSGARLDCIRHWKRRALESENSLLVQKIYGHHEDLMRLCRAIEPWVSKHACNNRIDDAEAYDVYKACVVMRRFIYTTNPATMVKK